MCIISYTYTVSAKYLCQHYANIDQEEGLSWVTALKSPLTVEYLHATKLVWVKDNWYLVKWKLNHIYATSDKLIIQTWSHMTQETTDLHCLGMQNFLSTGAGHVSGPPNSIYSTDIK